MTRPICFRAGLALAIIALPGCATVDGVTQTPCQRAQRAADVAHDEVQAAIHAGGSAALIAKLNDAAVAATVGAVAVCALASPPAPR